jgi:hypothetical protein
MNGFPWLTIAGAVPLLGAIVIALIPGLPPRTAPPPTGGRARRWPSGSRWRSRW